MVGLIIIFTKKDREPSVTQANDFGLTIVIPSKGRRTLARALRSLLRQSSTMWKAYVLFNGPYREIDVYSFPGYFNIPKRIREDPRIAWGITHNKVSGNCGGKVRNVILRQVQTEWVAFLDDDDTLHHDYVDLMQKEAANNPNIDIFIYRMFNPFLKGLEILPQQNATDIELNKVGITFMYKRNDQVFRPSTEEDYDFLHRACHLSARNCMVLPYSLYFVGGFAPHAAYSNNLDRFVIPNHDLKGHDFEHELTRSSFVPSCSPVQTVQNDLTGIFHFPDSESIFFKGNVITLKKKLSQALKEGCLVKRLPKQTINIVFDIINYPNKTASRTIYVFMEQKDWVVKLMDKMKGALQIWTFSPVVQEHLRLTLGYQNIYLVPSSEFHWDRQSLEDIHHYVVEFYFASCYYKFDMKSLEHLQTEESSTFTGVRGSCPTFTPSYESDVLFFGKIRDSDDNRREKICDSLMLKMKAVCVEGAYGQNLLRFIQGTRVIVLDRYYLGATLETHRLDLIIQFNLPIITTFSNDSYLDSRYEQNVIFVKQEDIVEAAAQLVANADLYARFTEDPQISQKFLIDQYDGLCVAIGNIVDDLRRPSINSEGT